MRPYTCCHGTKIYWGITCFTACLAVSLFSWLAMRARERVRTVVRRAVGFAVAIAGMSFSKRCRRHKQTVLQMDSASCGHAGHHRKHARAARSKSKASTGLVRVRAALFMQRHAPEYPNEAGVPRGRRQIWRRTRRRTRRQRRERMVGKRRMPDPWCGTEAELAPLSRRCIHAGHLHELCKARPTVCAFDAAVGGLGR